MADILKKNRRKSATSWLYRNFAFAGILEDGVIDPFLTSEVNMRQSARY